MARLNLVLGSLPEVLTGVLFFGLGNSDERMVLTVSYNEQKLRYRLLLTGTSDRS